MVSIPARPQLSPSPTAGSGTVSPVAPAAGPVAPATTSAEPSATPSATDGNVNLSKGSQAGTPLANPQELSFPPPAGPHTGPNTTGEVGNLDPRLQSLHDQIVQAKQAMATPGVSPEQTHHLQAEILKRIEQLEKKGLLKSESLLKNSTSQAAWTDAHSMALYPAVAEATRQMQSHFGGQITFFALNEMVNSLAAKEAKLHGPEAGMALARRALDEITQAGQNGREALGPVIRRWAQEADYQFNPSVRGEARFDPFVDPRRAAAAQRANERSGGDDSQNFQLRHAAELSRITNQMDERLFRGSLVTMDSLSGIFSRMEKLRGPAEVEEAMHDLAEVAQKGNRQSIRDMVQLLAKDVGYVFNPGLPENDDNRFDAFLGDRRDAYSDEGRGTNLAQMSSSHIGISISLSRGLIIHLGSEREAIRAPQWLLRQMDLVKDDPVRLRQLMESSEPLLTAYNHRPINFDMAPADSTAVASSAAPTPEPVS